MEILIVAATRPEIASLLTHLSHNWIASPGDVYTKGSCTVRILVSGIGMHRMSYVLGRSFAGHLPDLCINVGIAGAYPGDLAIGDVVHVTSEVIADLGAEDANGTFLTLETLGLEEDISSQYELHNSQAAQYDFLRPVRAITTNTTHGSPAHIASMVQTWNPDIESMEGAAFFYCCLKADVPFLEIRGISNFVTSRDRTQWNIPLAIENLTQEILKMIGVFTG